jgi:hypothetical protein
MLAAMFIKNPPLVIVPRRMKPVPHAIVVSYFLTFRNPASYIKDGNTATFNTPHFLSFFNKYTY